MIGFKYLMALFFFLVLTICVPCYEVDAGSNNQLDGRKSFIRSQDLKSTMPTIDNDFDCVDIYQQPAFNHPFMKDHKIQLNPTFKRETKQSRPSYIGEALEVRKIIEGCPSGKVPIYKLTMKNQSDTNSFRDSKIEDIPQFSQSYNGHHYATIDTTTQNTIYHGASAAIGGYDLSLQPNQYSISQIWLQNGPFRELNSIQVGVGVHPSLYGNNEIRMIGYWTVDNYQKTGCFNILCPGFVQINQNFTFGSHIDGHPSTIGSTDKFVFIVKVKQDPSTGHWWLLVDSDEEPVGYWPKEIFTHLGGGSTLIRYGGETFAPPDIASPPMGSGRLPQEKYVNSAFMRELTIVDSQYQENDVNDEDMKKYCDTSTNCYDLLYNGDAGPNFRQAFLFGGPGGQCGE